jgi:predicted transcriptional regulator
MKGQLTKAEEQVMQQLWKLGESFLRELVNSFEGKQPHQNTIATILKTLATKGFVEIEPVGRNNLYKPAITKEAYTKQTVKTLVQGYFKGSFSQMVSFFAKDKSISIAELEQILEELKQKH